MASTVPVFNDGDLPAQDCTPAVSTGKEARVSCLNWEWEDEMEEEEVVPRKVIYFRGWDREPLVVEEEEEISPEQQYEKHCAYVKAVLEELALLHFRTMSEEALGDDERKTQSKKRSFEVMADATTNNNVDDDHFNIVVSLVDPQPGETILDCCAAPGGKTLFIASCLNGQGMVTAVDTNSGRLRILKETAKLHQVHNVVTTVHSDLRVLPENSHNHYKYDKVLLDAPCSGLGLSKRADLRGNRRSEDMEELTSLQDELLESASRLVKPGGVLIYSMCSIDPEENQERIASFLPRHPEFSVDEAHKYVADEFVTKHGFYLSNPAKNSMD